MNNTIYIKVDISSGRLVIQGDSSNLYLLLAECHVWPSRMDGKQSGHKHIDEVVSYRIGSIFDFGEYDCILYYIGMDTKLAIEQDEIRIDIDENKTINICIKIETQYRLWLDVASAIIEKMLIPNKFEIKEVSSIKKITGDLSEIIFISDPINDPVIAEIAKEEFERLKSKK